MIEEKSSPEASIENTEEQNLSVNKNEFSPYTSATSDKPYENYAEPEIKQIEADKEHINALNAMQTIDLPLYSMKCNNHQITVLLDTGAGSSYIAPWLAQGLPSQEVRGREVETAGGQKLGVNAKVAVDLCVVDGLQHPWNAYVLNTKFDLILGQDWFKYMRPKPDWESDTWKIHHDGCMFTLKPKQK